MRTSLTRTRVLRTLTCAAAVLAAGTGTACAATGAAAPTPRLSDPAVVQPSPVADGTAATRTSAVAAPGAGAPGPANSIAGVPGTLFYSRVSDGGTQAELIRMTLTGPRTVLTGAIAVAFAEVSPDGRRIAATTEAGLLVTDASGHTRTVNRSVIDGGCNPGWSADSSRMLTCVSGTGNSVASPVVIDTAGHVVRRLPNGGVHYRWSGDNSRILYAEGTGGLVSMRADGTGRHAVPVLGSTNKRINPGFLRADDIVSVNADGSQAAIRLAVGDQDDTDIAGSQFANAVVDTATGRVRTLPVQGTVSQALFRADGTLLIRSTWHGANQLTVVSATGAVQARVTEPASLHALDLQDWTN